MNKSKESQLPRIDQLGNADMRPREESDFYDSTRLLNSDPQPIVESPGLMMQGSQESLVSLDEIEAVVTQVVASDVEHLDVTSLLQPEVATEHALMAYDVYVADTNYPPEAFVADYLQELSEVLCSPEVPEITQEDVDNLIEGVETLLKKLDYQSSLKEHHLVSS